MNMEEPSPSLPDGLKVCNCAGCGILMIGREHMAWAQGRKDVPPVLYGYINDRPYCHNCLEPHGVAHTGTPSRMEDDGGPWQQNAVRALEGE